MAKGGGGVKEVTRVGHPKVTTVGRSGIGARAAARGNAGKASTFQHTFGNRTGANPGSKTRSGGKK